MCCNAPHDHAYLYRNNRPTFLDLAFLNDHRIYRLYFSGKEGNPIEFPGGTYTALSCKWSFIIREEHVLSVDFPPVGDAFHYALVEAIRNILIKGQKNDGGNYPGWHKLTCFFNHDPKDFDYSHCEINIHHEIFEDEAEQHKIDDVIYTYELWNNGENLLPSKNKFLKELVKNYRKDIIKTFCL